MPILLCQLQHSFAMSAFQLQHSFAMPIAAFQLPCHDASYAKKSLPASYAKRKKKIPACQDSCGGGGFGE
jgi:hypothetical protein